MLSTGSLPGLFFGALIAKSIMKNPSIRKGLAWDGYYILLMIIMIKIIVSNKSNTI